MEEAMNRLQRCRQRIVPPDPVLWQRVQAALDRKTKPRGSLGQLERLACQLAAIRGEAAPPLSRKAVVVMAADHGVAVEGVSAYPQEVTAQMLENFARGGAAINALARAAEARVVVVDLGVSRASHPLPGVLRRAIAAGTGNLAREPAMTRAQALHAIAVGIELAEQLATEGVTLLASGEMGIANTTSASAIAALLSGASPEALVGRGTGVDDAVLAHKREVVRGAVARAREAGAHAGDPLRVLQEVGGFEIAGLCGLALGAAAARVPMLVDGFIASTAALCATALCPAVRGGLIAAHRSHEQGHALVLDALGLTPLLDLELRLGEGSGAALAMPLCDAALAVLREMASFVEAGVTDAGA